VCNDSEKERGERACEPRGSSCEYKPGVRAAVCAEPAQKPNLVVVYVTSATGGSSGEPGDSEPNQPNRKPLKT